MYLHLHNRIQPARAASLSTQTKCFLSPLPAVCPEGLKSSCALSISQWANLQQTETFPGPIYLKGLKKCLPSFQMRSMCRVSLVSKLQRCGWGRHSLSLAPNFRRRLSYFTSAVCQRWSMDSRHHRWLQTCTWTEWYRQPGHLCITHKINMIYIA